ncbi:UPF0662 protein C30C2.08 [Daldinia childiae]|uniref:UPF0662 protein C30C2.08 n=1 Tax=Daldinia childiae TaxID=326645 RepID=UPI00144873C3|nr:UPF0662 protein C30C2.08 [Daldinia childiae]KAF3057967.1 UPF0662 protein C30C2.08 [Daldinia childiae]
METPKIPAPKDEGEREVLEKLIAIRDQLQLRKLDRTTYVRTQDVMILYDQTIEQVRILNEVRHGKSVEENRGSGSVSLLVDRCLEYTKIVLEKNGQFPDKWRPIYDVLVGIRNDLDKLSLTQAWSLRETDLYDYQRQLDRIDESRVNGNWVDDQGQPAELYVQRTLLYLIRRSYGYIYHLMISSEPVSEALLPIYNQLQTLKRCLVEVKNSGGRNISEGALPL